ncbi:ATP-dependent nuclease [Kribbella sp. CA-247076]|uniref:ATP-dependent nuclease n=1 Tax=Kribbella sp. CA-247076 TaxID=3239941 RepID=UPI003D8C54AF
MTTPFRVTSLTFNSGVSVDTSQADIVVIVGPNNVGKSRALLEMSQSLSLHPGVQPHPGSFYVLQDLEIERFMDADGVQSWLAERRYTFFEGNDPQQRIRTANAGEFYLNQVAGNWDTPDSRLAALAPHLVRGLWCGERLQYLASPSRLDIGAHPEHPVHWLIRDNALMESFREAFWSAFGMHIVVDAWGSNYRLRLSPDEVQDDFAASTADGLPAPSLVERLAALSLIEEQSDGVRSFAGILLTLLTAQFPLVLLDEPEAFLHPPQARLLGRNLSELQRDGQLFVATHSLDVLLGLIESKPERVLILRLTRESGLTTCRTLPPDDLARLWKDPLLRFSRSLDGLFHDGVVVCEGDTDSQFYSAVSELEGPNGITGGRHVMFTYAGSKARIPLIANALRALGVPVRVVVDFDAINDATTLASLVSSVGGEYTDDMEAGRRLVDTNLRGSAPPLKSGPLLEGIRGILGDDPTREVTRSELGNVRRELEPETGWRAAKRSGKAAVPPGDATVALGRLLDQLKGLGIFVVPYGEVESFVKAVGGKGPRWVVEVVAGGHLETAAEAQAFVRELLGSMPAIRVSKPPSGEPEAAE